MNILTQEHFEHKCQIIVDVFLFLSCSHRNCFHAGSFDTLPHAQRRYRSLLAVVGTSVKQKYKLSNCDFIYAEFVALRTASCVRQHQIAVLAD